MWIRTGLKIAHTMYYFSSGGQSTFSHGVVWYRRYGHLTCSFRRITDHWKISAVMYASTWYHFTTTWHHEQGARMYRDGVLVDTNIAAVYHRYVDGGSNDVTIGKANRGGDNYGEAYVDDVIVYEFSIDSELVKYLYLSYFYWTFRRTDTMIHSSMCSLMAIYPLAGFWGNRAIFTRTICTWMTHT